MKYIDTDKLIAEIEKILSMADKEEKQAFLKKDGNRHLAAVTKTAICTKIKKLIASLQQEQPEVDLEKELHTYICSDEYMNTRGNGSLLIARHFYELGLNAKKK